MSPVCVGSSPQTGQLLFLVVNHPELVERLRTELRPTLAFCFFVAQRFRPELLSV